jgi:hypothetical protein
MVEKLDHSIKNIICSVLLHGWGYYYSKPILVIYEELLSLDFVRILLNQSTFNREIEYNNSRYFCLYTGSNIYHWHGFETDILCYNMAIKASETVVVVSSKKYDQAVRVLLKLKKKIE